DARAGGAARRTAGHAAPAARGGGGDRPMVLRCRRCSDRPGADRRRAHAERGAAMTRREQLAIGAAVPGAVLPVAAALFGAVGAAVIGMPTTWVAVVAAAALLGGIVRMIGGAWIAAALVMAGLVAADAAPWRL